MPRILITGANRGIGAELTREFRSRGSEVLATARGSGGETALDVSDPALTIAGLRPPIPGSDRWRENEPAWRRDDVMLLPSVTALALIVLLPTI